MLVADELDVPGDATHFHDSVHLTDRGMKVRAGRVLEVLTAAPELRALLDG